MSASNPIDLSLINLGGGRDFAPDPTVNRLQILLGSQKLPNLPAGCESHDGVKRFQQRNPEHTDGGGCAGRRNADRFPDDFLLKLTNQEVAFLRSHFAILKTGRGQHRKCPPLAEWPTMSFGIKSIAKFLGLNGATLIPRAQRQSSGFIAIRRPRIQNCVNEFSITTRTTAAPCVSWRMNVGAHDEFTKRAYVNH
jgi:hypothetical protein